MVEAEVVDTATETNGYAHSEPSPDKLTTVGEEKKVLLRQNHYSNNTGLTNGSINNNNSSNNAVSNDNINNSRQSQQRNTAIFSNPIKQAQQMPYKRSPSPAQQQWQSNRGNYWSGQQKMSYHSPYMQNNNYNNGGGYRNDNNQSEQLSRTNLYIRGLPHHTTDDELANMCKRFGKITSTKAITDKQSNKCKGYGFVDFESPEAAQKACQHLTLQGTQASFAKMSINDQIRKQQHDPSKIKQHNDNIDVTNLYISNLPRSFTEEQLNSLVMPFGEIVSSRILKDPEGNSKGVGFARLESKELCEKAIKALNGKPVTQGGEPLIVKFAEAPNPNKKRPLVYFAPAWAAAGAGMEDNGQLPAMSFVQPMYSDVSLQQNGASAIPTPGPRPLLIHPSMQMVPLPIQYNNIPNGQWMSPQFVPLTTFPPQLSPVDHHALASQMGQLHLGGGYIGTPNSYTPYSTPQAVSTNSIASENHTTNDAHHPNYTIYDTSLQ
ncbi:RNA-binding motif, single-stranded-interacting protein 2-like isoform X2 [Bolinopsis microptera]|uniref:RNA-binding motif, single-stranded-interacting protein 2-like isoform X2 n=2 Tax=Bolinopsis microptera TaxID=2820187 RepID=UPI003079EB33